MRNYFGTDGIRGIANEFLSGDLAFRCGNALAQLRPRPLIVVGRDTRVSGDMLTLALAAGAMAGGADVYDLGVIPTAGVAFLTKQLKADYGVVVSASHNPAEYNGIKVFSSEGYKLDEDEEAEIEAKMSAQVLAESVKIGRFAQKYQLADLYVSGVLGACSADLKGMRIALDCSNGAAYKVAPEIFGRTGVEIFVIGAAHGGADINEGCGSLHPERLAACVLENGCDMGFAFDGDADRLIAVDEKGKVADGDKLIYMLACAMKKDGTLKSRYAVGTAHTNAGVERALAEKGVTLLRSDIGDKYVKELMLKKGANVGGEQSGHIILTDYATTGDGILSALVAACVVRRSGRTLSALTDVKLFPQYNVNVRVKDKVRVLGSETLSEELEKARGALGERGRVVVRASGTEQVVRVFAETEDAALSESTAKSLAGIIEKLED